MFLRGKLPPFKGLWLLLLVFIFVLKKKKKNYLGRVVIGGRGRGISLSLRPSLVYRRSYTTAKVTQRNPVKKTKKQTLSMVVHTCSQPQHAVAGE